MSMKPSERIEEIYRTRKDMTLAGSIIQYLDEQAELLETHTVKEECTCQRYGVEYKPVNK